MRKVRYIVLESPVPMLHPVLSRTNENVYQDPHALESAFQLCCTLCLYSQFMAAKDIWADVVCHEPTAVVLCRDVASHNTQVLQCAFA